VQAGEIERCEAIGCGENCVALALQVAAHQVAQALLVFDDKDRNRRHTHSLLCVAIAETAVGRSL
jgi:hypothetical protein